MSRKKASTSTAELDRDLLDHIHGLGLGTVEEYRDWCARNGFGRKLKKHWNYRCRERFHAHRAVAQARLDQKKREKRNFRAKLFDGSPVIAELGELPGNTFVEALALAAAHIGSWLRPVGD
jgi:hypothetical protein